MAADGPTNGAKGDKDAATWLPPNKVSDASTSPAKPPLWPNTVSGSLKPSTTRLLWEGGQRHGDGNYEHVSLEGAKTAQALAFSLVAMIHEELIAVA
jgi:hypothetical protein